MPRSKPLPVSPAVLELLDAQTCLVEFIEGLVRNSDDVEELDALDRRAGDAMRHIAKARAELHQLRLAQTSTPLLGVG